LIADGKVRHKASQIVLGLETIDMLPQIKVKSGVEVSRFDKTGVQLSDGSRLDVDGVIFATGYDGDMRESVAYILPQKSKDGRLH
jgi:hypothetical protein